MTTQDPAGRGAYEASWDDLLADPNLTFGGSELLPHLLAFGPPEDCLTCRPGIYCPTHTPRGTA